MLPGDGGACSRARTRARCFLAPLESPAEPLAGSKLSLQAFHLCLTHILSKEQSPCMRFPTLVGRLSEWFSCQGICIRAPQRVSTNSQVRTAPAAPARRPPRPPCPRRPAQPTESASARLCFAGPLPATGAPVTFPARSRIPKVPLPSEEGPERVLSKDSHFSSGKPRAGTQESA